MKLDAYVGQEVLVQFKPGNALLIPIATPAGHLGPAMVGEAQNQQPLVLPFIIGKVVKKSFSVDSLDLSLIHERVMIKFENGVQKGQPFFVEVSEDAIYSVIIKGDLPLVLVP